MELHSGTGFEIDPQRCGHPELAFVHAYWQKARNGRLMPSRADLVIRDLKKQLGWLCLLDVLPDTRDFRYRLIGTKITLYFGTDTTGKTVTETFAANPDAGAIMTRILQQVVRDKVVIRTYGDLSWLGRGLEDFESLFLPFSDDGTTVSMVLNPFTFDERRVQLNRTPL
ncbi:MAG TPA: PAS domain-containing protein [Rhizomicrobium sp.]|nr:PAS domain-containing protein [Rhizomicrobium sp.]